MMRAAAAAGSLSIVPCSCWGDKSICEVKFADLGPTVCMLLCVEHLSSPVFVNWII